eukprot:7379428-Prymnesium_polylepis.1
MDSGAVPTDSGPPRKGFRLGDRVCVLWNQEKHGVRGTWYGGEICDSRSELDGRRVRMVYHVAFDDGSRTWHGDGQGATGKHDLLIIYEWQALVKHSLGRLESPPRALPAPPPAAAGVRDELKLPPPAARSPMQS